MIASAFIFCINDLNYTEPQSNLLTIHICLSNKIFSQMDKYFSKGSHLPISNCTKFNTCYFDFKLYEIAKVYEIAKPYSTNRKIQNNLRNSLAENNYYLLINSKIAIHPNTDSELLEILLVYRNLPKGNTTSVEKYFKTYKFGTIFMVKRIHVKYFLIFLHLKLNNKHFCQNLIYR